MNHEPEAYRTNKHCFLGMDFYVDKRVLIPRPETEQMVEEAIGLAMSNLQYPISNIADLGTGSGCIAITLAKKCPQAKVAAADISKDALEVAELNAKIHGVSNQIEFIQGDFLAPLAGKKFDLIISNPPYIPSEDIDGLMKSVRDFEPRLALDGGADGMDYIRRLIKDAPAHLNPNGVIIFEMEYRQGKAVRRLCPSIEIIKDYQGIERIGIIRKN